MTKLSGFIRANKERHTKAIARWEACRKEIEELYLVQGLSQRLVGEQLGISQHQVGRVLRMLGIEVRESKSNMGEKNGRFVDGSQSRMYRKIIVKEICAKCGATTNLVIHHLNYDHYDNRKANLIVLCGACHRSLHKADYWDAVRNNRPPLKGNGPVGWKRG